MRSTDSPFHTTSRHAGFTLLEVLIALAIVGVALGASVRAIGIISANRNALEQRTLALEAANDTLIKLRLEPNLLVDGAIVPCPQGAWRFNCRQQVRQTVNVQFRRVEVQVYLPETPDVILARLAALTGRRQ